MKIIEIALLEEDVALVKEEDCVPAGAFFHGTFKGSFDVRSYGSKLTSAKGVDGDFEFFGD
jgi:hypothetical protein